MNKKKTDIKKLAKSFKFAFCGIIYCIKRERNMRIHITMILPVIFSLILIDGDMTSWLFVISAITLVIFAEMINTAIENIVAKITSSYDLLVKAAKDIAAGAVLVSSIYAVIVAFFVYIFSNKWTLIVSAFINQPVLILIIGLYIIISVIFIFSSSTKSNKKKIKE